MIAIIAFKIMWGLLMTGFISMSILKAISITRYTIFINYHRIPKVEELYSWTMVIWMLGYFILRV